MCQAENKDMQNRQSGGWFQYQITEKDKDSFRENRKKTKYMRKKAAKDIFSPKNKKNAEENIGKAK